MTLTNKKEMKYRDNCNTCLSIGCIDCLIDHDEIPLVKLPKYFPQTHINIVIKHINKYRRKKSE